MGNGRDPLLQDHGVGEATKDCFGGPKDGAQAKPLLRVPKNTPPPARHTVGNQGQAHTAERRE